MFKNRLKITLIILLLITGMCASAGYLFYIDITTFIKKPLNVRGNGEVFIIKPGQNLKQIAANLEKQSIISNKSYFILFAKYQKADTKLQAGEYILSASRSPQQILEILKKGKVKQYRLTVPEGLNVNEVALVAEKAGFCSKSQFNNLCRDASFISSFDIKAPSLEGYLFPDTYFFPKHASCREIISKMVENFNNTFTKKWKLAAEKMNFSIHDTVTLASIIEKETGDASERAIISSVFHNRLERNMRLESDPTVIYGIKNFDGNIKRKHLRTVTPYNTYQIKGLPAGPIANPGALSLHAALYPEKTSYLFFVSKKDSTHKFSETIKEHNKAVKKYQLR